MKYRPQRGSLAESMAEVVEIEPNLRALRLAVVEKYSGILFWLDYNKIEVTPYCYDDRIGWRTHVVRIDGQAVGFTDGPCTENGQ